MDPEYGGLAGPAGRSERVQISWRVTQVRVADAAPRPFCPTSAPHLVHSLGPAARQRCRSAGCKIINAGRMAQVTAIVGVGGYYPHDDIMQHAVAATSDGSLTDIYCSYHDWSGHAILVLILPSGTQSTEAGC